MTLGTVIAIYFLLWWVVLFAVLPWGARSQDDSGEVTPGTDPGAPAVHRIWIKLLWTTLIATALFAVLAGLYRSGLIPVRELLSLAGPPNQ
jgi:predicted secreted protein